MAFDVFISYPHQNKVAADAACGRLEAAGIRCWIAPRDVPPGAEWAGSIVEAIDNCRVMLLIFSSHANQSKQVHREVQRAFDSEKPVVPFRIENVMPVKALAYYMGSVHWLDALTPPLEQHLSGLVSSIGALVEAAISEEGRGKDHSSEKIEGPQQSPNDAVCARSPTNAPIAITQLATLELAGGNNEKARSYWADWAPNGNHVVTVGQSDVAELWDVSTGECFGELSGHESDVRHATYSRDGKFVATVCDDGSVRIWDLTDNRTTPFFCAHTHGWLPRQVSISSENKLVACADFGGRVSIFEITEGGDKQPLLVFKAQRSYCLASEFSPSNDSILTCGAEGTAELWPVPDLNVLRDGFKPRTSLVFRGHVSSVHNASFAAGGDFIATASRDGTARVWDAKTGRQIFCTQRSFVDLDPVAGGDAWRVNLAGERRRFESGQVSELSRRSVSLNSAHIAPTLPMVVVAEDDNLARIWSLKTGEILGTATGHTKPVRAARFSPDGTKLVTASFDNTARIWAIRT